MIVILGILRLGCVMPHAKPLERFSNVVVAVLFTLGCAAQGARSEELCIVPSSANSRNATVMCTPNVFSNGVVGYNTDGLPCDTRTGPDCTTAGRYVVWTLSSNPDDPFANSGPLDTPILYLWLACTLFDDPIQSAEFGLSGDLGVVGLVPLNGFSNSGTATELLLSVPDCPSGPLVAAEIQVASTVGIARNTWGHIKALYH
jgi:hypothetical protein